MSEVLSMSPPLLKSRLRMVPVCRAGVVPSKANRGICGEAGRLPCAAEVNLGFRV